MYIIPTSQEILLLTYLESWPKSKPIQFNLKPDEETTNEISLDIPEQIPEKEYNVKILFDFDQENLPSIEKKLVLTIISSENLGNLITNGDFESPARESQNY